jgi:protein-disulfide isomerase
VTFNRRSFLVAGIAAAMVCVAHAQDVASVSADAYARIVANPETPAAGAGDADITIVEFFDYNCPICRKMHPRVVQLLHEDPHVRVLYKEWPIFGEVSTYAARSAIAASWQGKYLAAHEALIASSRELAEMSDVDAVLKDAGVDLGRLQQDRKRHPAQIEAMLARAAGEAEQLGLQGTPGFLVGRQFIPRSMDLPLLKALVARARSHAR